MVRITMYTAHVNRFLKILKIYMYRLLSNFALVFLSDQKILLRLGYSNSFVVIFVTDSYNAR